MKNGSSLPLLTSLVALLATAMAVIPPARASNRFLSVYIGGAYGHARLAAKDIGLLSSDLPGSQLGGFDASHSAYQIIAGIRGLDLLGAEFDYFDLGSASTSPSWSSGGFFDTLASAQISQKGEAAFALLYLPVPVIDVYLKAGIARLTTRLYASAGSAFCPPGVFCPVSQPAHGAINNTETAFGAGAGVQWTFGAWALRAEYERFTALGEHPSLVSVGATWSFF
jgi:opacity protein-like surface antigen